MIPARISDKLTDLLADVEVLWCDIADGDTCLQAQVAAIGDSLLELKLEIEREGLFPRRAANLA
jgi:hypothetical protein